MHIYAQVYAQMTRFAVLILQVTMWGRLQADASLAPKGRGDEGARYQADIVCLDDGLHSIVRAIVRGRLLHKNIRSYVQYRITVSIVMFIIVFAGCLSGCAFLFSPLQLIWIKLVSGKDKTRPFAAQENTTATQVATNTAMLDTNQNMYPSTMHIHPLVRHFIR